MRRGTTSPMPADGPSVRSTTGAPHASQFCRISRPSIVSMPGKPDPSRRRQRGTPAWAVSVASPNGGIAPLSTES